MLLQACEKALLSLKGKSAEQPTADVYLKRISTVDAKTDDTFENEKVIEKIKRLKDCAMASASSHSGLFW